MASGELTPAEARRIGFPWTPQMVERARRIAIPDCDVHQGNGTASILANDLSVFNFSIRGARNFPLRKETSDLGIELADGTGDADYLNAQERGICHALSAGQPELGI